MPHELPVAVHAHLVGDREHLVHLVRDVDHRDPARLEDRDDREQVRDLFLRQGGGGLVHDHQVGLAGHGFRDLHLLHLRDAELAHDLPRREVDVELFQQVTGGTVDGPVVDESHPVLHLAAQEDVLRDGHVREGAHLLVDHGDALRQRVMDALEHHLLSAQPDGARVRAVQPDCDLHERGLSRRRFPP